MFAKCCATCMRASFRRRGRLNVTCRAAWKRSACVRWRCDPAMRYASAKALAGDIEHWLADEPVSALPETSVERMQRWMRRHKTWTRAAAATLVIIAGVAGVAYTREAGLRNEVQTALNEEAKARREADEARNSADRNAALAKRSASGRSARHSGPKQQSTLALATLKSVLFDIQAKLKNVPAAHTVRLSMLNTVIDGLKQVARNLETAAETDHSLVRAHLDLGDIFLQVGADRVRAARRPKRKRSLNEASTWRRSCMTPIPQNAGPRRSGSGLSTDGRRQSAARQSLGRQRLVREIA